MFLCNTPIPSFEKPVTNHNCPHFPATLKNSINPSISFPFLLSPASPFTVNCSHRNGDPDQKLSSSSAFDVLGVDPNCSAEELKSAFRARVKEFHPDVRKDGRDSDTMIRLVIQAYELYMFLILGVLYLWLVKIMIVSTCSFQRGFRGDD